MPGTPEWHHQQDYNRETQQRMEQSQLGGGGLPPQGSGYPLQTVRPSRPLLSKWLLITIPLGVLLFFFPKNGKDVQIPGEVHFFFAVVVAWLGSPRLRPIAIGITVIIVVFVVIVTLWTNHVLLRH